MECPKEVTVEMTDEALLEDMDGYDPDSYDEESIDWLGVEKGNSMETIEPESWEDLHALLEGQYKNYVLSDPEVEEGYEEWLSIQ